MDRAQVYARGLDWDAIAPGGVVSHQIKLWVNELLEVELGEPDMQLAELIYNSLESRVAAEDMEEKLGVLMTSREAGRWTESLFRRLIQQSQEDLSATASPPPPAAGASPVDAGGECEDEGQAGPEPAESEAEVTAEAVGEVAGERAELEGAELEGAAVEAAEEEAAEEVVVVAEKEEAAEEEVVVEEVVVANEEEAAEEEAAEEEAEEEGEEVVVAEEEEVEEEEAAEEEAEEEEEEEEEAAEEEAAEEEELVEEEAASEEVGDGASDGTAEGYDGAEDEGGEGGEAGDAGEGEWMYEEDVQDEELDEEEMDEEELEDEYEDVATAAAGADAWLGGEGGEEGSVEGGGEDEACLVSVALLVGGSGEVQCRIIPAAAPAAAPALAPAATPPSEELVAVEIAVHPTNGYVVVCIRVLATPPPAGAAGGGAVEGATTKPGVGGGAAGAGGRSPRAEWEQWCAEQGRFVQGHKKKKGQFWCHACSMTAGCDALVLNAKAWTAHVLSAKHVKAAAARGSAPPIHPPPDDLTAAIPQEKGGSAAPQVVVGPGVSGVPTASSPVRSPAWCAEQTRLYQGPAIKKQDMAKYFSCKLCRMVTLKVNWEEHLKGSRHVSNVKETAKSGNGGGLTISATIMEGSSTKRAVASTGAGALCPVVMCTLCGIKVLRKGWVEHIATAKHKGKLPASHSAVAGAAGGAAWDWVAALKAAGSDDPGEALLRTLPEKERRHGLVCECIVCDKGMTGRVQWKDHSRGKQHKSAVEERIKSRWAGPGSGVAAGTNYMEEIEGAPAALAPAPAPAPAAPPGPPPLDAKSLRNTLLFVVSGLPRSPSGEKFSREKFKKRVHDEMKSSKIHCFISFIKPRTADSTAWGIMFSKEDAAHKALKTFKDGGQAFLGLKGLHFELVDISAEDKPDDKSAPPGGGPGKSWKCAGCSTKNAGDSYLCDLCGAACPSLGVRALPKSPSKGEAPAPAPAPAPGKGKASAKADEGGKGAANVMGAAKGAAGTPKVVAAPAKGKAAAAKTGAQTVQVQLQGQGQGQEQGQQMQVRMGNSNGPRTVLLPARQVKPGSLAAMQVQPDARGAAQPTNQAMLSQQANQALLNLKQQRIAGANLAFLNQQRMAGGANQQQQAAFFNQQQQAAFFNQQQQAHVESAMAAATAKIRTEAAAAAKRLQEEATTLKQAALQEAAQTKAVAAVQARAEADRILADAKQKEEAMKRQFQMQMQQVRMVEESRQMMQQPQQQQERGNIGRQGGANFAPVHGARQEFAGNPLPAQQQQQWGKMQQMFGADYGQPWSSSDASSSPLPVAAQPFYPSGSSGASSLPAAAQPFYPGGSGAGSSGASSLPAAAQPFYPGGSGAGSSGASSLPAAAQPFYPGGSGAGSSGASSLPAAAQPFYPGGRSQEAAAPTPAPQRAPSPPPAARAPEQQPSPESRSMAPPGAYRPPPPQQPTPPPTPPRSLASASSASEGAGAPREADDDDGWTRAGRAPEPQRGPDSDRWSRGTGFQPSGGPVRAPAAGGSGWASMGPGWEDERNFGSAATRGPPPAADSWRRPAAPPPAQATPSPRGGGTSGAGGGGGGGGSWASMARTAGAGFEAQGMARDVPVPVPEHLRAGAMVPPPPRHDAGGGGGNSNAFAAEASSELECGVCLQPYCCGANDENDPIGLPCGHTFCLTCVTTLRGKSTSYLCPTCRRAIPAAFELKPNTMLRSLIHMMKKHQR